MTDLHERITELIATSRRTKPAVLAAVIMAEICKTHRFAKWTPDDVAAFNACGMSALRPMTGG